MSSFEVKEWSSDGASVSDSNMAMVGSDMDKDLRKQAALGEAAWEGKGLSEGLEIFRVEKMKIKEWPKEFYGKFYSGDSYIVLVTKKVEEKLVHDIFFWLGSTTSQDEMGVAAYKTVELDDFFDQEPIQHREVMESESQDFMKLFKQMEYLEGGIESGFNKVEEGAFVAKLFRIRKVNGTIKVLEMVCNRSSLNQGDCFILDLGETLYPWFGDAASAFEKAKAGTVSHNMASQRNGKATIKHDPDSDFWQALGGEGPIADANDADKYVEPSIGEGVLYKLSDQTGKLMCTEVARGDLTKDMLTSDDVYILDVGPELFVYVGASASHKERRSAMTTAISYCATQQKPLSTPIHVFKEGHHITNTIWNQVFSD